MTATSRHAEMTERALAAWARRRRLWAAGAVALAVHAAIYFTGRAPVLTSVEFGIEDPAPSMDVELVEQAPEPDPMPEPPEPEPPPEPPKPEPPPEPPQPADFSTPLPPTPEPKPKPVAKPERPRTVTSKPAAVPRTSATGGPTTGTASTLGGRTAGPGHLFNPKPAYPAESKAAGEQGVVTLRVSVDVTGRPTSVALARSCGHPRLDRAAEEAVRRWRFRPATRDGVPFATSVDVPVRFSLR